MKKIAKLMIAAVICGVVGFNAAIALNINSASDITLANIEALAQGEDDYGCYSYVDNYYYENCYYAGCYGANGTLYLLALISCTAAP